MLELGTYKLDLAEIPKGHRNTRKGSSKNRQTRKSYICTRKWSRLVFSGVQAAERSGNYVAGKFDS